MRLTEEGKSLNNCSAADNFDAFDFNDFCEQIYEELQKYENFMEQNEIDSIENITLELETCKDKYESAMKVLEIYKKTNTEQKQELDSLKAKDKCFDDFLKSKENKLKNKIITEVFDNHMKDKIELLESLRIFIKEQCSEIKTSNNTKAFKNGYTRCFCDFATKVNELISDLKGETK